MNEFKETFHWILWIIWITSCPLLVNSDNAIYSTVSFNETTIDLRLDFEVLVKLEPGIILYLIRSDSNNQYDYFIIDICEENKIYKIFCYLQQRSINLSKLAIEPSGNIKTLKFKMVLNKTNVVIYGKKEYYILPYIKFGKDVRGRKYPLPDKNVSNTLFLWLKKLGPFTDFKSIDYVGNKEYPCGCLKSMLVNGKSINFTEASNYGFRTNCSDFCHQICNYNLTTCFHDTKKWEPYCKCFDRILTNSAFNQSRKSNYFYGLIKEANRKFLTLFIQWKTSERMSNCSLVNIVSKQIKINVSMTSKGHLQYTDSNARLPTSILNSNISPNQIYLLNITITPLAISYSFISSFSENKITLNNAISDKFTIDTGAPNCLKTEPFNGEIKIIYSQFLSKPLQYLELENRQSSEASCENSKTMTIGIILGTIFFLIIILGIIIGILWKQKIKNRYYKIERVMNNTSQSSPPPRKDSIGYRDEHFNSPSISNSNCKSDLNMGSVSSNNTIGLGAERAYKPAYVSRSILNNRKQSMPILSNLNESTNSVFLNAQELETENNNL